MRKRRTTRLPRAQEAERIAKRRTGARLGDSRFQHATNGQCADDTRDDVIGVAQRDQRGDGGHRLRTESAADPIHCVILRAFELSDFLAELRAFEHGSPPSAELAAVGGPVRRRA